MAHCFAKGMIEQGVRAGEAVAVQIDGAVRADGALGEALQLAAGRR